MNTIVHLDTAALVRALVSDANAMRLLAERLAEHGLVPTPPPSPYMNAEDAASYLCAPSVRTIYDMVSDGRLTRHGTPRHLLVARAEVAHIARGR